MVQPGREFCKDDRPAAASSCLRELPSLTNVPGAMLMLCASRSTRACGNAAGALLQWPLLAFSSGDRLAGQSINVAVAVGVWVNLMPGRAGWSRARVALVLVARHGVVPDAVIDFRGVACAAPPVAAQGEGWPVSHAQAERRRAHPNCRRVPRSPATLQWCRPAAPRGDSVTFIGLPRTCTRTPGRSLVSATMFALLCAVSLHRGWSLLCGTSNHKCIARISIIPRRSRRRGA
jgi:hypothetical protein